MDKFKMALRGSDSRDRFKFLHKNLLPKQYWALNSDLELVEKSPVPFVVARLDFKMEPDSISFTEAISYQRFITMPMPYTIPVYIIVTSRDFKNEDVPHDKHRFRVEKLLSADYRPDPPIVKTEVVADNLTWSQLGQWEGSLRRERQSEMARFIRNNRQSPGIPAPLF